MAVFGKRWSKAELTILDTSNDINELKKRLPDRTLGAIKTKKAQLQYNQEPTVSVPWSAEEIALFPKTQKVDKAMLAELAEKLEFRDKNAIWKKLKSMGHVWIKTEIEEPTEDNPYPMHGKLWTEEELALFPTDKIVTKEIIDELAAKLPLRKPSSIWPKMKKEGYVWEQQEEKVVAKSIEVNPLSNNEKYVLSIAHELGFRAQTQRGVPSLEPQLTGVEDCREQIASKFNLPEDFTGGELYCAIGGRISPLPWDIASFPEVATAHRKRDPESILAAAKVLHKALEAYING